jgi:hypothetical protein
MKQRKVAPAVAAHAIPRISARCGSIYSPRYFLDQHLVRGIKSKTIIFLNCAAVQMRCRALAVSHSTVAGS